MIPNRNLAVECIAKRILVFGPADVEKQVTVVSEAAFGIKNLDAVLSTRFFQSRAGIDFNEQLPTVGLGSKIAFQIRFEPCNGTLAAINFISLRGTCVGMPGIGCDFPNLSNVSEVHEQTPPVRTCFEEEA